MTLFLVLWIASLSIVEVISQDGVSYSNTFIMKGKMTWNEANAIAKANGFELLKQSFEEFFILRRRGNRNRSPKKSEWDSKSLLQQHPEVEYIEQEHYDRIYPKSIRNDINTTDNDLRERRNVWFFTDPDDQFWVNGAQWYALPNAGMHVYEAWDNTKYNGEDIVIGIVDDGIEVTHTDLKNQWIEDLSYDFINNRPTPNHRLEPRDSHGTMCAGIAAAEKGNGNCIAGIAYGAQIAGLKFAEFGAREGLTHNENTDVLQYKYNNIHIYSCSWGYDGPGTLFIPSTVGERDYVLSGLQEGTNKGRNGRGSIYLFAGGNDESNFEDSNADVYKASIHTIVISSAANDGSPAWYSQSGTSIMASTYGGSARGIATTNVSNTCTDRYRGTSAATPAAAGIIALVLEANPTLTWRDVQYLITETSGPSTRSDGFYVNAEGKSVSLYHGFGIMNAEAMINKALNWKKAPEQKFFSKTNIISKQKVGGVLEDTMEITHSGIDCLEHVQVWVDWTTSCRGNVEIYLISPSGTESRILRNRKKDNSTERTTWTFLNVHSWGEQADGSWTLKLNDRGVGTQMVLHLWRLHLYGVGNSSFCPRILDCAFDRNFCGWKVDPSNTFPLKIQHGPSHPTFLTGPKGAKDKFGKYLWADASKNEEKFAKIISPEFPSGEHCFQFNYHMYGRDVGTLSLKLLMGEKEKTIAEIKGDKGDEWRRARAHIKEDPGVYNGTLRLQFGFKMGQNYLGDIAIDEVSLMPGKCTVWVQWVDWFYSLFDNVDYPYHFPPN